MKKRRRRGLSFGSVVMLIVTAAVLAGFGTLLPRFSGGSFDQNAAQLAVALDQTIVNFSSNLSSIAAQNDFAAGYLAVGAAVRAIQGQSYFQVEPLEFVLVRQENMYEPENQKLLFPVTR